MHEIPVVRLIPIVPTSGLWLIPYGHGDDDRFAGLFRDTWRRIPLRWRRLMVGHWRRPCGIRESLTDDAWCFRADPSRPELFGRIPAVMPRVELLRGWDGVRYDHILLRDEDPHATRVGGRHEHAAVFAEGLVLRFFAPNFDRMPDGVARDVIAHELAHVVQCAIGYERRFGHPAPDAQELEDDADDMMAVWGFDPESVDLWGVGAGTTEVVECKDLAEAFSRLYGPGGRYYDGPRFTWQLEDAVPPERL